MEMESIDDYNDDILKNIQFSDLFDVKEIQNLQDLFSDANGVASIITDTIGTPITMPSNFTNLCINIIRKTEKGCSNCYKSDASIGRHNPSGPIVQHCLSGGLWDAGASITVGGKHLANWLIGQVRGEDLDMQKMEQYAFEIGANREDFINALEEVPSMPTEKFHKISKMLFAFAHQLSEKAYNNIKLKKESNDRKIVTQQLKKSNDLLAITLQSIGDGVISTDIAGLITMMNPTAERLTGWNFAEAKNQPFHHVFQIVNATTRKTIDNPVKKVLESGEIMGLANHTILINRNGNEFQIADSASPIMDNQGNVFGVIIVFSDVTQKYKMENSLRESEERFRVLFEGAPDAIILADPTSKKILDANRAACLLLGRELEELIGMFQHELHPASNENYSWSTFDQHLEESFSIGYTKPVENIILRPDGAEIPVEILAQLLQLADKKILLGTFRDISSRKKMEQDLITAKEKAEESEEKFRAAFFSSPDSVNINKLNGEYIEINEGFTRVTGYTKEDIDKKSYFEIDIWAIPEDRDKLIYSLNTYGIIENMESVFRAKDGTLIPALMSAQIIKLNNEPHILSVTREIADRKKMEQDLIAAKEKAEESDRLKTAFLNNVSHEIRTPMNAIIGFSELLVNEHMDTQKREEFSLHIKNGCNKLLNVISDVIEISQLQAGQMHVTEKVLNIETVLEEIKEIFSPKCIEKKTQLLIDIQLKEHSTNLISDNYKIFKILYQLIDNAIKFTYSGYIKISCTLTEDNFIQFSVVDTGIGITSEMQQKIFEPFRQVETGQVRNYGGNGIGLSISKSFVEMLGGQIWLTSEPNKGTEICFTIPYKQLKTVPATAKINSEKFDLTNKVILVAEDEITNFQLIEEFLSKTKVKILHVSNGIKAVDMCRNKTEVDLILMDIKMPEMDGQTATKLIKEFRPDIPIIAITAYSMQSDKELFLKNGFDGYLSKPIQQKLLIDKVMEHINRVP